MKKITFSLLLFVISMNIFAQTIHNEWLKVEIPTTDNLQKIIFLNGEVFVFSQQHYYKSSSLSSNWQESVVPFAWNSTPTVLNGHIYINANDGVYMLQGSTWIKKINQNFVSIASNGDKLYLFTYPGSSNYLAYYSEDGENLTPLPALNDLVSNTNLFGPSLKFSKCIGDTILISGLASLGPVSHSLRSYDGGVSWLKDQDDWLYYVTDFDCNDYAIVETKMHRSGRKFVFQSSFDTYYPSFEMSGGIFCSTKLFNHFNWAAGITRNNGNERGIIMCYNDIGTIFYPPEPINTLASNGDYLLAAGRFGALYLLTGDYFVGSLEKDQKKESINIYPNPTNSLRDLNLEEEYEIYDVNGKKLTNEPASGLYIIRTKNNKFAKIVVN
jgi:hypothetical protein